MRIIHDLWKIVPEEKKQELYSAFTGAQHNFASQPINIFSSHSPVVRSLAVVRSYYSVSSFFHIII